MTNTNRGSMSINDGTLYYETAGDGMPLVLSHAAFLDSRMFDAIWEPLAEHFRVIRYDMRGFGQSGPVTGPICRREELHQLMVHLGISRAHLLGCSNGGQNSLDLALEFPELVESLILVGSTPSGFEMQGEPPRYLFEMFDALQQGNLDLANELQIRIWLDGVGRAPEQVDSDLRQKALEMNRIPVTNGAFFIADGQPLRPLDPPAVARLEQVACPTLIVAGALDHSENIRASEEMARRIPLAEEPIIVPETGHVPGYEKPELFVKLVLDFLSR
jgi:pimeloyl-ACP methyl ester carboxylesterase